MNPRAPALLFGGYGPLTGRLPGWATATAVAVLLLPIPAASSEITQAAAAEFAQPVQVSVFDLDLELWIPPNSRRCVVAGRDITRPMVDSEFDSPKQEVPIVGVARPTRNRSVLGGALIRQSVEVRTVLMGATDTVTDEYGTYTDTRDAVVFTLIGYDRAYRTWPHLTDLIWHYTLQNCDLFRLGVDDVEYLLRAPHDRRLTLTWLWTSLGMEPTSGGHWPERNHLLDGPNLLGDLAAECRHPKRRQCSAAVSRIWSETGDGPQGI